MGKGEFLNIFMAQNAQHGYVIKEKKKKKKKKRLTLSGNCHWSDSPL